MLKRRTDHKYFKFAAEIEPPKVQSYSTNTQLHSLIENASTNATRALLILWVADLMATPGIYRPIFIFYNLNETHITGQ